MKGLCDHCSIVAELVDVGHGIRYCEVCRRAEAQMLAGDKFVNQHGRALQQHNPYPGERRGPLTREDKARVCILAREAFEHMHGRGPATQAELGDWRREQQRKACGFDSLTLCQQEHLAALEAHFLDLKGESGQAFRKLMQPQMRERQKVLGVLQANLRTFGLMEGYAATICRSRCKCELGQASVKQLWHVIFTIRRNQQRKARGGKAKK